MAKCENCPALDEGYRGIEHYEFGKGCPDDDFDVFGGDCIGMKRDEDNDCPDCGGHGTLETEEYGEDEYGMPLTFTICTWCKTSP